MAVFTCKLHAYTVLSGLWEYDMPLEPVLGVGPVADTFFVFGGFIFCVKGMEFCFNCGQIKFAV